MSGVFHTAPDIASREAAATARVIGPSPRSVSPLRFPPFSERRAFAIGTGLIGLSLLVLRWLSESFPPGTTTADHPVFAVLAALLVAGFAWMALLPVIRRLVASVRPTGRLLFAGLALAVALRAVFFGSHAVYEDDFRRYLWDGAVAAQGIDPYAYSPAAVSADAVAGEPAEIATLRELSTAHGDIARRINNPQLTTIYPPTALAVFTGAAVLSPMSADALRFVFLLVEIGTLALLVRTLRAYGRDPLWALAYALCPLVIFAGFNTLHMDILLVPCLLGAMLLVARRPVLAALSLALAVGVKFWPLVLGPVLFRQYRREPLRFVGYGLVLGLASLALLWPMVAQLGGDSGLQAYSEGWVRSSFLFPLLQDALVGLSDNPGRLSRMIVAAVVSTTAIGLALFAKPEPKHLPHALMAVTLVLLLLSPTGYPWYAIWVAAFLPFAPWPGAALLCVTVSLYYVRFWLGESGRYGIYTDLLVPLQFGLPILCLSIPLLPHWRPRHA